MPVCVCCGRGAPNTHTHTYARADTNIQAAAAVPNWLGTENASTGTALPKEEAVDLLPYRGHQTHTRKHRF